MPSFAHSMRALLAGVAFVAVCKSVSLAHAEDGGGGGAGAGSAAGAGAGSGSTGTGHAEGVAGHGEGEGGEGGSSSAGATASPGSSGATGADASGAAALSGGGAGRQRLNGFSTGGERSARMNAAGRSELRSEQDMARDAMSRGQIHPLDSIQRHVEGVVPGPVLSARLRKDGASAWTYSLVILSPDGRYHRVEVDAVTNAIIQSK
jgi:hypothetical protein